MNIISVEHLPTLAVVSKGKPQASSTRQILISNQAGCVNPLTRSKEQTFHAVVNDRIPPLTIVSKGKAKRKAKGGNAVVNDRIPPLTMVSKGKAIGSNAVVQDRPITMVSKGKAIGVQDRLPPMTMVSKGKAICSNAVAKVRLPALTMVSKGKAIANNAVKDRVPPSTILSKEKSVASNETARDQIREAEFAHPLAVVQTIKSKNPSASKPGKQAMVKGKPLRSSLKKPLVVKKYANISAPVPLFGPFKSKIPFASNTHGYLQTPQDGIPQVTNSTINESEWTPRESSIHVDSIAEDYQLDSIAPNNGSQIYQSATNDATHFEDPSVSIMEKADKAVQTDCFCQCYHRGSSSDSDMEPIFKEVKKISAELQNLKMNITGKAVTKLMDGIFPIKSEASLAKIQYNMDNTENFEIRLTLYLKYLKPKSSTTIATAIFQQLISDDFLKGKNWDGGNNFDPINNFTFFKTTLFDAWKNSVFTKDVYIAAMRNEIGKSHDRERKRNKNK